MASNRSTNCGTTKTLLRGLRRGLVGVAGTVLMLLGLVLVPLPGPGWLVVLGGLAVLSTEFDWALRLRHRVAERLPRARGRAQVTRPVAWVACLAGLTIATLLAVAAACGLAPGEAPWPVGGHVRGLLE